jgi:asparagine synthase (glutamine-hydrolysing)
MCGICAVLKFQGEPDVDRAALARMNQSLVHRGPDEEGMYVSGRVGLAMRRLSIIDVATGHQPATNEDESVWLVYNGEIYNHEHLRTDLINRGHRYQSRSDTETIVHLYEEYGRNCVQHLRGMFAFVLWDTRCKRLFAARDRLGIKPLYYWRDHKKFLFASEIKALLAHPGINAQFNRTTLPEYLAFGYLSGTETMFSGVRKLPPGHILELDEDGVARIERYWDLPHKTSNENRPKSYYVQTYGEMLEQAVSSHLMSDVPLGVFLSGGWRRKHGANRSRRSRWATPRSLTASLLMHAKWLATWVPNIMRCRSAARSFSIRCRN